MPLFQTPAFIHTALLAAAPAVPRTPFYQTTAFINVAIFTGLVIVAGLIGHWLAKALRATDYGWKFGVILFALLASAVVVYRGWPPRLGVDLGGGSILVYKVDETKTVWRPEKMESLLTSISKRVNPGGQKEISVKSLGTDMVEIVMPSVSGSTAEEKRVEADEIRKIIRSTGALEFRIVATRRDDESLIEKAKAERKKYPAIPRQPITVTEGKKSAKWCRIRDEEADKLRTDEAAMMVGKDDQGKEVWDMLVLNPESEAYDVTGRYIRDARAAIDQETATPEVEFSFTAEGGAKFGRLTGEHVPIGEFHYKLAIVLDDILQTAPRLISAITDRGRITGNFTQKEVDAIVEIINAGSLPAALEATPVRDMTTDATLGAETIRQSTFAMIISSIAVPLFMLVYYRFAGLVAVLVLSLNMLMLVALMILIKAPFTLPALAGLALTVGMAVDNNVLIYERLREELAHGAALRMAIRNAFHRVGVVIIDANITHLIAATVLWSVGTEQIKGFAVTFWLGAILSIWATMFVARVIFEVAERRRWIQRLAMMQWIGHTKIDFMAWFPACATFSVLITVLGIVVAGVRGKSLFDIDFTGGVSVQTVFQQEKKIDDVREQIKKVEKELPDATVTNAHNQDEPDRYRFIVDTSNSNNDQVKSTLKKLFGEELVTLVLIAAPIAPEKTPASTEEKTPASTEEKTPASTEEKTPASTEEKTPAKTEEKTPEKPAAPTAVKAADKGPSKAENKPEKSSTKPEEKPSEPPSDKSPAKPAENKPAETKPAETKPAETKPAETKPAETKPAETKPAETKPAETKPAETKPAETKPAETKPAETKPAETKPAETKPAETKPAETKPAETKPAETKPAETKPAETKPAETKPAETKPAETKPAETKPAETKPAETKPAETNSKQSELDLPPASLVAMAGPEAVLLAQADAKSEKPDAKPPAAAAAKTEAKTTKAKPEDKPPAKVSAEKTPLPAPAEAAAPQSFEAALTLSSTVAKLEDGKIVQKEQAVRFDEDRLRKLVEQALEEHKVPVDEMRIDLSSPDKSKKSDRWDLKLTPRSGAKTPLTSATFQAVVATLQSEVRTLPYFPIEDNIGSAVANDTRFWAVVALVSSWSLIILYLWIRFQGVAFGLAAVIALIHDVLVMLGAIAFSSYLAQIPGLTTLTLIEPFKINLPIVAAFLTIIGYSVNDTIVVFDRIREIRGKSPTLTRQMVNDATNQTLSRTVLTSFTVMLVVIILYIFGGTAVHGFAFALIIGVLTGTYSSIYVAAPILLWLLHPKEMRTSTASETPVEHR